MPKKPVSMRSGNKGLAVKINFFPVNSQEDAYQARRFIKGQLTHADTREVKMFNDAGELLTTLGVTPTALAE